MERLELRAHGAGSTDALEGRLFGHLDTVSTVGLVMLWAAFFTVGFGLRETVSHRIGTAYLCACGVLPVWGSRWAPKCCTATSKWA